MNRGRCVFIALIAIALACGPSRLAAAQGAPANGSGIVKAGDTAQFINKAKQAEQCLDFGGAADWYEKAAEIGDARSMYELGWIYFGAHDIPGRKLADYPKAAIWFRRSADLNYLPAVTQLGVMYGGDGSLGVAEDQAKAAQLFLRAAKAGDAQAMNNLALKYSQGKGLPRDIDAAIRWWRKAVEVDKNGPSGKAAQSWLDLHNGKPFCPYCAPSAR
jgi:TPR repeat protein